MSYEFQDIDADAMVLMPRSLLAHEAGLGKTKITITTALLKEAKSILVICPAVARSVWVRQWKKWAGNSPHKVIEVDSDKELAKLRGLVPPYVLIINYDYFSRGEPAPKKNFRSHARRAIELAKLTPDFVALDESHYLKSFTANRTREVLRIAKATGNIVLMSGTPAPNHSGELYPVLSQLFPEAILSKLPGNASKVMSEDEYMKEFCITRDVMVNHRLITMVTGSKNGVELKQRMSGFTLRRLKKDTLKDLPPMVFDILPLKASGKIKVPPEFKLTSETEDFEDDFLALLRSNKVAMATARRELGMIKAPMCVEWALNFLGDPAPGGDKLLIFAYHHDVIDYIKRELVEYHPVVIDGRVTAAQRDIAEDTFMNSPKCRVFIGQISAAGTALTLTAGSTVLFAESDFVPGNNVQAASRAHRIGQLSNVVALHACLEGSKDVQLMESLAKKEKELFDIFG